MQSLQGSPSPLYKLPPLMWGMGAVGWIGCHLVKFLAFPAAIATPAGCAAGAIVACPAAAVCAFMAGYGAHLIDRKMAKTGLYAGFGLTYPWLGYKSCLVISGWGGPASLAIVLAALVASFAFLILLKKPRELTYSRVIDV